MSDEKGTPSPAGDTKRDSPDIKRYVRLACPHEDQGTVEGAFIRVLRPPLNRSHRKAAGKDEWAVVETFGLGPTIAPSFTTTAPNGPPWPAATPTVASETASFIHFDIVRPAYRMRAGGRG